MLTKKPEQLDMETENIVMYIHEITSRNTPNIRRQVKDPNCSKKITNLLKLKRRQQWYQSR